MYDYRQGSLDVESILYDLFADFEFSRSVEINSESIGLFTNILVILSTTCCPKKAQQCIKD